MSATRSSLVRLPAGKVHVLPAYSDRTLCGVGLCVWLIGRSR